MKTIEIIVACLIGLGALYVFIKILIRDKPVNEDEFPILPRKEREKMSRRFKDFCKIVIADNDEIMIDKAAVARQYMLILNQTFDNYPIDPRRLDTVWTLFKDRMAKRGVYGKYSNMQGKMFLMDVNYIVRHLWEHTGKDGVVKNGDDMHLIKSSLYESDEMRTPEQVFNDLSRRQIKKSVVSD